MILQVFLLAMSANGMQVIDQREMNCDGNLGCDWECKFALFRHPTAEAVTCHAHFEDKVLYNWNYRVNPEKKAFYCDYFHVYDCPEGSAKEEK